MRKTLAIALFSALVLSGCGMRMVNRLAGGGSANGAASQETQLPTPTDFPTEAPTRTPVPTATTTPTPTPDATSVGLPAEASGQTVLDFVARMCEAQWFNRFQTLPCPGDDSNPDAGYVLRLPGDAQGLSPNFPVLMMYAPQDNYQTIFSKYPAVTVQKGDRFRAVLECRAHTFCDVEFALEYYKQGWKTGVAKWPYMFNQTPIVVDYPLDGMAGLTVQFGLAVRGNGDRLNAYGAWVYPHIYRPAP